MPCHIYELIFPCDLIARTRQVGTEIEDVAFLLENELPPLSLSRVTPKQIAHLFGHLRHPESPVIGGYLGDYRGKNAIKTSHLL